MAILWHATKQLALVAPTSPVYKEHLAICDHKEVTIRLTHCYVSPPSFSPSPTSAMPSPILPMPSAPQTMTLTMSSTLLSILPPIRMAPLPSSDPAVSPLPRDTLLYGQHGPSSTAAYIPQCHY